MLVGETIVRLIVGAASTVIFTELVTVTPALFVTVNIKVVVAVGNTVVEAPELTASTPLSIEPEPLLKTATNVTLSPSVIVVADAVKLEISGDNGEVSLVLVLVLLLPPQPTRPANIRSAVIAFSVTNQFSFKFPDKKLTKQLGAQRL